MFYRIVILLQITQIDCDSDLRAPAGCTQYFYGQNSQTVRSYNFNGGAGTHLGTNIIIIDYFYNMFNFYITLFKLYDYQFTFLSANQQQNVCVR